MKYTELTAEKDEVLESLRLAGMVVTEGESPDGIRVTTDDGEQLILHDDYNIFSNTSAYDYVNSQDADDNMREAQNAICELTVNSVFNYILPSVAGITVEAA